MAQITDDWQVAKPWLAGLREYQLNDRRSIIQAWKSGYMKVLYRLPTGGGKSVIIRSFLREFYEKGKKVLLISHDTRILAQLVGHALQSGIPQSQVGVLKAWKSGEYPLELFKPIQVGMIQSLQGNWEELTSGLFPFIPDVVIVDEAHHCSGQNTYFGLWERFPTARFLGVTATPARPNGGGFFYPIEEGKEPKLLWDVLIHGITKRSLIEKGFLPECETWFGLTPNLKGVAKSKGEFKVSGDDGLENRYDRIDIRGDIIRAWREYVYQRFGAAPTVCFGVSVDHIINIADDFCEADIPAVALHGGLSKNEQDQVLQRFIKQEAVILCLCGMGQEGFDLSSLAESYGLEAENIFCCIKALATASLVKNSQLDGRVRGLDLMKWDFRSLPALTPQQDDRPQPQADDVVLGGKHSPLAGSLVLGGMQGIDNLLKSPNFAARVAGIKKAIAVNRFDLLKPLTGDPSDSIRSLIETILEYPERAESGKLLYGVIIDAGNNLERHDTYDAEHEWSLDGVKAKPVKTKICPECQLAGISAFAQACANCGYVFKKPKVQDVNEGGVATGDNPREIRHNKQAEMGLLDPVLWREWQSIKSRSWNDYSALKGFARSNPDIADFVRAGKTCTNKDGRKFRDFAIFATWVEQQVANNDKNYTMSKTQITDWSKALGKTPYVLNMWFKSVLEKQSEER